MEATTTELEKAVGAFIIALGQSMSRDLAQRISNNLMRLADQISDGGEPTVGTICKGFAEALLAAHEPPPASH